MDIRRIETSDAIIRFEQFENRIERMEAEADLVNYGRKNSLEEEISSLECDEELEKELKDLKASSAKKTKGSSSAAASRKTMQEPTTTG